MPVGGNMRLGFGRKVDKRTGEKENYVTGYKQYSKECTIRINYISTESIIKAGMYMNDTTVLLEKTKEQS
jgi:hypothetical protein